MANPLTGDYDAVLLVRVTKINALLATLHQNGGAEDVSPTFPHSVRLRIGTPRLGTHPDLDQFAEWFNELRAQDTRRGGGATSGPAGFSENAPPGAAQVLREAFADLQAVRFQVVDPVTVRGTVRAQLSAPSITLPAGSTAEVTVRVHVRAHYTGDPGTLALPEPLHGQLQVTYSVRAKRLQNFGPARTILQIDVPQDDGKIQFHPAPGTGLGGFELSQISARIRKAVREAFEPINVELPGDFQFFQFKEIGAGQAIALPVRLRPPFDLPPASLNTVTNSFLNDDFSVAISKEFVESQLQPTIEGLREFRRDYPNWWTTYHVSVTSVEPEWPNGAIDLIIKATAKASRAPDYDVTIRQRLTLVLDPSFQRVSLGASNDDLTISLSGLGSRFLGFVRRRIRADIIPERDAALPQAEELINDQLTGEDGARAQLNKGLKSVDDSASARYSALHITPDGLIFHGRIFTTARPPAVVEFGDTNDGTAFTAHKSWIPAGRITRFEWSWIMQNPLTPWGQRVEVASDEHRFIFPKPLPGPGPFGEVLGDVCLRIEGAQTDSTGNEHALSAGEACSVSTPEVFWRMPPWSDPMFVPVWHADTAADAILEETIAAHVNVLAHAGAASDRTANALVHFADSRADKPLDALGQALAQVRHGSAPLLVIVVLPSGMFGARRREVEAKLGSLGETFSGRLLLTEDYTGSWKRTFDAHGAPSTSLMNDRGEFVWKQDGVLEPSTLAAAVDEHFTPGRPPRSRSVSLRVRPGDRAPRALFTVDTGQQLALRKLQGHPVLLNFWQPWSAPSIRELRRLQRVQERGGEGAPVIVAVNGADEREVLTDVRRKHGLTFALVHDSRGLIADQVGVYCVPTTISIDPDGIVTHVQLGTTREEPSRQL